MNTGTAPAAGEASRAWVEAAEALLAHRDLRGATEAAGAAEVRGADPDRCSAIRWMSAMLGGNFERAWVESDGIRKRGRPDPHRFWNGEELQGARVIARSLHGYGDAVQMLRYAPLLRKAASKVIWEVQPRMVELARHFNGVDEVITWEEKTLGAAVRGREWDVQLEVMELPYIFRTQLSDLPLAENYLWLPDAAQAKALAAMRQYGGPGPRIGLAWTAGEWNPGRALPLTFAEQLLRQAPARSSGSRCDSAIFWSLHPAPQPEGVREMGMLNGAEICGDGLVALAATIANLDLVITVDTLVAHLAGAMGRPVWLMLQHAADWRWMADREDSPWYPTMRIFRQPRPGDWASVVERVGSALEKLLSHAQFRLTSDRPRNERPPLVA